MSRRPALAALLALATIPSAAHAGESPDYAKDVAPILKKYCAGCHNGEDREGDLSLETYAALSRGTPRGAVLKARDASGSRLIRVLTGASKPAMPPKDEPRPSPAEVEVLKAWVDAGAAGPSAELTDRLTLVVPKIEARSKVRPVTAIEASRDGRWLAVARPGSVALYRDGDALDAAPVRTWGDFPGKVNAVHFTPDSRRLVTASGVAGLGGVAAIYPVDGKSPARVFRGHRDILFDAELSPDGKMLATCSYDRTIELWDAETGRPLRTLAGHNGAVYDVAFSPDGRFLVSASADDTCKVWRVVDGLRMDTLPQPLKEESCCAFSPDGRFIAAGGADNTVRVWRFISADKPRTNPMIQARFAHEGPVVRLAFTPDGSRLVTASDDRSVKAWETSNYTELQVWDGQPDVVTALAISGDGTTVRVGRIDGSLASYRLPGPRPDAVATPPAAGPDSSPSASPAGEAHASAEREPNDSPKDANPLTLPARVSGVIERPGDVDIYRFHARAGEPWVFEVDAARSGSPLDPFVEVLDASGHRVERVRLQAVRSSYFTFRGKDDSTSDDFRVFNWEEMRLGEYLYANGEVVKLWLYPRGPDSGFRVSPGQGKRWGYFDTTPLAHPLGETCYIVEPRRPGAPLLPNGLPVFPIYFENDDDSKRELGKDSRLTFTAPADGDYLVKVRDVRGLAGPGYKYTLLCRPSRPDFQVALQTKKLAVGPGEAQEFKLSARRIDGFEGPIRVELSGLPRGLDATSPVVIEPGQVEALGVVAASPDAARPTPESLKALHVTASADIRGREVRHEVSPFAAIELADKPKLLVRIEPSRGGPAPAGTSADGRPEFVIRPGQTIELKVRVTRNGHAGTVPFGNEGSGRNLPFGVYVDNLGLNGLLIPEGQDERTFFVTADRIAAPQVREFHLTTSAAGGHSSLPVFLRVQESAGQDEMVRSGTAGQ